MQSCSQALLTREGIRDFRLSLALVRRAWERGYSVHSHIQKSKYLELWEVFDWWFHGICTRKPCQYLHVCGLQAGTQAWPEKKHTLYNIFKWCDQSKLAGLLLHTYLSEYSYINKQRSKCHDVSVLVLTASIIKLEEVLEEGCPTRKKVCSIIVCVYQVISPHLATYLIMQQHV